MTTLAAPYVQSRVYMDTIVTIEVCGALPGVAENVERAFGWFSEVERRCSRFDPNSELCRLCARTGLPVLVSPLLFRAIEFAIAVGDASGGAFDPTIGAQMRQRGFDRNYRSGEAISPGPSPEPTDASDVCLDAANQTVTLRRPLQLDLGAVAKGLAVDLAAAELQHADGFLINAGGDIRVHGLNPEGGPWRIGIKDPLRPSHLLTSLSLTAVAICTSGGYERPAAAGGHHILSPSSGVSPAGVAGVTVVTASAMVADALSTAAFVLGCTEGLAFAESQAVEALLVDSEGRISVTDGMKGYF